MSEMRRDFGDVTAEYRAARFGIGFVTGTMGLLWAEGSDAIEYLDGQLSQDLRAMEPGSVGRALLLEPRGKLTAPGWALAGERRVGFAVDATALDAALERLTSFMFRVEVELSVDERPIHVLWGSGSAGIAREAGLDPGDGWADNDGTTVALLHGGAVDRVLVAGGEAALRAAGASPVGAVAWNSVRIEAGEPVMGIDIDESTIPQESGLVPASVSFTKGCYVGQELVARIDSRGRVNQRLAGLVVRENVVPPIGARVIHDGEERGTISSVGESLTLRAPVAMGMVRREVEDGAPVEIAWDGGGVSAVVRPLPLDDFSDPPHTFRTPADEGDGDETETT